jgi:hypothetical protein
MNCKCKNIRSEAKPITCWHKKTISWQKMLHSLRSKTLGWCPHKIMFLFVPKYIVADCRSFTLNCWSITRINWLYAYYFYYCPMYLYKIILSAAYPWSLSESNAVFPESASTCFGLV